MRTGPAFLARWVVATAIGWVGGIFVAIILSDLVVNLFYHEETNLIVGLCMGGTVAALQVLAVRRRITLPWSWIWGGMVIMAPPTIMVVVFDELGWNLGDAPVRTLLWVVTIVVGALGVAIQARALRTLTEHWRWWIPAAGVAWGATAASSSVVSMQAGGIVLGVASGALLSMLLRRPPRFERAGGGSGGPDDDGRSGGPDVDGPPARVPANADPAVVMSE